MNIINDMLYRKLKICIIIVTFSSHLGQCAAYIRLKYVYFYIGKLVTVVSRDVVVTML